jgi:anti-sigma regulatory factor (Ser/Thr protein kinase)
VTTHEPAATERFAATSEEIPRATAWADAAAARAGAGPDVRYAIQVCVEELASNLVRHGQPQAGELSPGWFGLSVAGTGDVVTLEFLDDAAPFDITAAQAHTVDRPLDEVAIGGLGIGLIRSMSQSLAWERRDRLNRTTLSFVRAP